MPNSRAALWSLYILSISSFAHCWSNAESSAFCLANDAADKAVAAVWHLACMSIQQHQSRETPYEDVCDIVPLSVDIMPPVDAVFVLCFDISSSFPMRTIVVVSEPIKSHNSNFVVENQKWFV